MKPKKILVPLDGSSLAEIALPEAAELARGGATLVLLRAAEPVRLPAADPTDSQVEIVREAEDYLASVAGWARKAGVAEVQTSVSYAPAAEAIIAAARVRNVDLIVMSTHGRSGLGRLVLGSVAETVVRGTTTPILLLRKGAAPPISMEEARTPAEASRV
jgi:nucleotide-binding universal stress UspA family protein